MIKLFFVFVIDLIKLQKINKIPKKVLTYECNNITMILSYVFASKCNRIEIEKKKRINRKRCKNMTENKKKTKLVRIAMNFPEPLLNQVKDYAESLGVNMTNAFIFLVNQALQQKDMFNNFPIMISLLNELKQMENTKNFSDK